MDELRSTVAMRPGEPAAGRRRPASDAPSGRPPLGAMSRPRKGSPQDLAALAALTLSLSPFPSQWQLNVRRTLDWLRRSTGAEAASLFLVEHGSGDLVLAGHRGPVSSEFGAITRFAPGEGLPGLVVRSGRPVVTPDLAGDPRLQHPPGKAHEFRSAICVPLVGPDGVAGTLGVASRRSGFDLAHAERLLIWAGAPLAATLSSALLSIRQATTETGALAGADSGGAGRLDWLLGTLVRRAMAVAGAQGAALLLFDPHSGAIARCVTAGTGTGSGCNAVQPGAPFPCPILLDRRAVVLAGTRDTWPNACRDGLSRAPASYCLPLTAGGSVIGLLRLAFQPPLPSPTTERLPLALEIALGAALAVRLAADPPESQLRPRRPPAQETPRSGGTTRRRAPPAVASVQLPAPYLELRCFGNFEVRRAGALVTLDEFHWRRAQTLLKILVTHRGRPVPRDTLIEWLWPDVEPGPGANRLYVVVHALRRVIEPPGAQRPVFVHSGAERYTLRTDAPFWLDVDEFLAHIQRGKRAQAQGELGSAAASFAAAIDLYRGDFLVDEPYAEWCWLEREHLRETCLDAVWRAAAIYTQTGDSARSAACYARALQLDPLREESLQGLLRSLAAAGRPAEALREYQRFEAMLQRELGIPPLPETRALAQQVRAGAGV